VKGTIRSEQFDDVYFSADDGLAETAHVFLDGNDLPQRFEVADPFVIAETGFGTGLNFLAAWRLFDAHKRTGQRLHFISFELYPLEPEAMRAALQPWTDVFGERIDQMLAVYPRARNGRFDVQVSDGVILSLIFGDVNTEIQALSEKVDCWFLDGFTPAKNPQMWTQILFDHMVRLSKEGASFATFTAAGFVKRGLQQAGFTVCKKGGFGKKRDMLAGVYKDEDNTK